MDPLSILREYATRGEVDKIVRVNNEFRFGSGGYTLPCTTRTAYKSKHGDFYTLETLVHYLQHAHLKHTEYLQTARASSIPTIMFLDRKPLLDYLTGKLSSSDSVVVFPNPSVNLNEFAPDSGGLFKAFEENDGVRDGDGSVRVGVGGGGVDLGLENGGIGDGVGDNEDYVSIIRSNERPLRDREGLLECRNRDFYSVLVGSMKREEDRQRIESHQRKDGLVAKSRLMGADVGIGFARGGGDEIGFDSGLGKSKLKGGKLGEGVPIILVPSAFQTLITIYNVKEFLEDGVFIPTDVKVKQMKGPKPECVTVQKKFSTDRNRVVSAYEVRDKPSALKSEDWDRVVAVFVLGKEWQFKDWPFKDHVEIFNKIIGFYMRFEDDSVESAKIVKQWNVKIISISKNKRHQDRAAALEVWDRLEEFVRSRSHS